MAEKKITIARLWPRYQGKPPSRAPVILGFNQDKYKTICIYLKQSSDAPNYFEQQGLKAYYISRRKFFRIFNFVAVWKVAQILRREKVDILHCHRHQAVVYGTTAAIIAKTPVVIGHVHGLNRSVSWRRRLINKIILRRLNRILTVGKSVKDDVLKWNPYLNPDKIVSLGNSIDASSFMKDEATVEQAKKLLNFNVEDVVFGTVGRLTPTKGYEYLIQAFHLARHQVRNAKLIFIGDGRLRETLQKQAENLGCSDNVHFLGKRNDVPELLKAMDVFVLSSVAEGIPRALLEAMAASIPCVATTVGGIPEIISQNEVGFLVESKNADVLAAAMVRAAALSTQDRKILTTKARQRVTQQFSHDVVRSRLETVYNDALTEKWKRDGLTFRHYLKYHLDFLEIENKELPLTTLSTQYNPNRFKKYKSVHEGPYDLVLKMSQSPHCRLLQAYKEKGGKIWRGFCRHPYYKMQRRFGKSKKAAIAKAQRLVELYKSIKQNGFASRIIVVDKPIVPNPYNDGYEIYEGHHRVACCIVLGMKTLPATIVKAVPRTGLSAFRNIYTGVTALECDRCVTYQHCLECETQGDSSLRRCQRTIEKQYYTKLFDKDILEIGCGTSKKGGYVKAIVESNRCRWTGIDILPTDLATHVCSVEKMPFHDESFDYVIGCQTIEHWKKTAKALREIRRILRPDGIVSLTAPVHLHGSQNFVTGDFDTIQTLFLKNGFAIERFETWRQNHSDLPKYQPNSYSKKYLLKAGIIEYDNVVTYIAHFILKKRAES